MSDIGPENLRKMAENEMFALGVSYDGGIHFQDSLRMCADAWEADKKSAYRAGIEAAAKKLREIAEDRDLTGGEQMLLNDAADIVHILPDQEEKP